MDSKMKPLWLVWKNAELAAGTKQFESFVMFKKGDGTRVLLVLNNLRLFTVLCTYCGSAVKTSTLWFKKRYPFYFTNNPH